MVEKDIDGKAKRNQKSPEAINCRFDMAHVSSALGSFILVVRSKGPPLWSSGQSFLLQIQGSRVRFPATTKKKKKVVGLEWGPLSLVSTTEELLDRKVAAPV
jgi:hypothetical protein